MKRFLIFCCLVGYIFALSNAQAWKSSNALQGDGNITAIVTKDDSQNNIIVYGYFDGTIAADGGDDISTYGGRDFFIAKFSKEGNILWINKLGSTSGDDVRGGLAITADDEIMVSGAFPGYLKYSESDSIASSAGFDMFMAKYEPDGTIIWCKNIGSGPSHQRASTMEMDTNGDLIVTGTFKSELHIYSDTIIIAPNSNNHIFIEKLDPSDGSLIWVQTATSLNNPTGGILSDLVTSEDGYFFAGSFADSIILFNDTLVSYTEALDGLGFMTDTNGNLIWQRKFQGYGYAYCQNVSLGDDNNIYFCGAYNSPNLVVDSTGVDTAVAYGNNGSYDFYITSYTKEGDLRWLRTNGGKGSDKLANSEFFGGFINVSGTFADTLAWGGVLLSTQGTDDSDAFTGSLDSNGNYRSANSFGGINNSEEDARAIFYDGENLYEIIRSNSEILQLGEDIYASSNGKYYVAIGIVGCNPISIDNTIYNDVTGCYGDSTGSIQVATSGGFGSPWQYSIDDGQSYHESPIYAKLPAGSYRVVVIDKENCAQTGPLVVLAQPDTLEVEVISVKDITIDEDGSIVVAAVGGTSPYTYTLLPDDVLQGFGTYTFAPGDSGKYVISVNDLNQCGPVMTDTLEIKDLTIVGMNELGGIVLRVFPNPVTDVLTVEMPMEAAEVSMEVLSLAGQVVLRRQAYTTGGVLRETIDVSDLASGMYMLRVNGQTLKSAIVVN